MLGSRRSNVEAPYTDDELAELGLRADRLPRHVAIIMDGNGRWARARGLPRIEGHRRGVQSVRAVVEEAARCRLEQLTLYCLSSENWKRPALELELLMHLLHRYVVSERELLMDQDVRFCSIGRVDRLPKSVHAALEETCRMTAGNRGLRLCLALDYGARDEIVRAVRVLLGAAQTGMLAPADLTEQMISDHLDTAGRSDPDLMIRTAGEMRVSNFLLWQMSYSELWVSQTYWPDFGAEQFREALHDFAARDRRFGGLKGESASGANSG
ncbi:MAG: di-trans,poly-cis-decaprenylcistransferase [Planctomyces sp.]|nr:di-trans,poly-cis-decaprenylcistransferase [Planctomyces sp.]